MHLLLAGADAVFLVPWKEEEEEANFNPIGLKGTFCAGPTYVDTG